MVGKTLDNRYKLEKKIGSGGMADVYMATDLLLDRVVAVKVLHSSFAEDNDFIVRFRHEAQSAGKLTHPNIVGIYDVGDDQGVHYIVMEYIFKITAVYLSIWLYVLLLKSAAHLKQPMRMVLFIATLSRITFF